MRYFPRLSSPVLRRALKGLSIILILCFLDLLNQHRFESTEDGSRSREHLWKRSEEHERF